MEVKLDLTKDELVEIAKMTFLAQFVMDSSGTHSTDYKYPNLEKFLDVLRELNKTLLPYIKEYDLLEVDGRMPRVFTHTMRMEDEMAPVLEQFSDDSFLERICKAITDREYIEDYDGVNLGLQIIGDNGIYDILYQNNLKELKQNGLKNVRLQC